MDKLQPLEEGIAHLTRMVEDLSDVVARQEREIIRLKSRGIMRLMVPPVCRY